MPPHSGLPCVGMVLCRFLLFACFGFGFVQGCSLIRGESLELIASRSCCPSWSSIVWSVETLLQAQVDFWAPQVFLDDRTHTCPRERKCSAVDRWTVSSCCLERRVRLRGSTLEGTHYRKRKSIRIAMPCDVILMLWFFVILAISLSSYSHIVGSKILILKWLLLHSMPKVVCARGDLVPSGSGRCSGGTWTSVRGQLRHCRAANI